MGRRKPPPEASRAVLTAVEGHVIASCVQGLPAAGGAPGWGPGIRVGAGPGLHLLFQDQPANSALELGVGRSKMKSEGRTLRWNRLGKGGEIGLYSEPLPFLPPQCPSLLAAPVSSFGT